MGSVSAHPAVPSSASRAALSVIATGLNRKSAWAQSGSTVVRAYADGSPGAGFEPAEAELEDVYFSAVAGHLAPGPGLPAAGAGSTVAA